MCGIFGLVRNSNAPHPERATAAFVELGHLAIERGRDSAGFAFTHPATDGATSATRADALSNEAHFDQITVVKDTGTFDALWNDRRHVPMVAASRLLIGHTRWATQGQRDALINASPLTVGSLIATHNGDIAKPSIPRSRGFASTLTHGSTDTERLFAEINDLRGHRRKITDLLSTVEGRAALAWFDQNKPDRLLLGRAALSPLSIAWDAEGNLYWASNPRWFRDIDAKFDGHLGFKDISIIREGILLTVRIDGDEPLIEDMRQFKPTCRASDERLSDAVVWRGFDAADRDIDQQQANHRVAAPRPTTRKKPKIAKPALTSTDNGGGWAATRRSSHDRLWSEQEPEQSSLWDSPETTDTAVLDAERRADMMAIDAFMDWRRDGSDATEAEFLLRAMLPSEIDQACDNWSIEREAFEPLRRMIRTALSR